MASIPQNIFSWQAVEASPDIERLTVIFETLDDEALMARLEARRKGRRNDNPVRAMWNSLIAALVFGHDSIEKLRRELARNAELRQTCGFTIVARRRKVAGREVCDYGVPSADAYSRFLASLCECQDLIDAIFAELVRRLGRLLPDFGLRLAVDGKAIVAARSDDRDATVGAKRQGHPDGDEHGKVTRHWRGYKLHMLCDATHELPVAFELTDAAASESPRLMGLVEKASAQAPEVMERAASLCADRGYDDGADKAALWSEHGIEPVIPARDLTGGRFEPLDPSRHDTLYVSPTGQVSCRIRPLDPDPAVEFAPMQFCGFERDRQTLKFRCPAEAFGIECLNRAACGASARVKRGGHGRTVRVRINSNPRLFGPLYAHSYRFEDLYRMRTSVERLFFRLDHMYGFERHHTVGMKRMGVRVSLALIAMQATAVGWIEAGRKRDMRRLYPAA